MSPVTWFQLAAIIGNTIAITCSISAIRNARKVKRLNQQTQQAIAETIAITTRHQR